MPYTLGVWSEREGGDWEACVISSYLEALVYGGWDKFPLGVYSQPEREALEVVPDEPQDYNTTDQASLNRYGVKLRRLTVDTIAGAASRPGVGLLVAGYGGLLIPTTAPIHSVFWADGLVYDPLAPNQSAGQPCSAARITAWAKGPGWNDAREVRHLEFVAGGSNMPVIESMQGYPDGSTIQFVAGKPYQFFGFDLSTGARTSWAWTPTAATAAETEALVDVTGDGPAYFLPKCFDGNGIRERVYLPVGYVDLSKGELFLGAVQGQITAHTPNRKTTVAVGGNFMSVPQFKGAPLIKQYPTGTEFFPDWTVEGEEANGSKVWHFGTVHEPGIAVRQGYFHASELGGLEIIEEAGGGFTQKDIDDAVANRDDAWEAAIKESHHP